MYYTWKELSRPHCPYQSLTLVRITVLSPILRAVMWENKDGLGHVMYYPPSGKVSLGWQNTLWPF